jgi:hypothetical protein
MRKVKTGPWSNLIGSEVEASAQTIEFFPPTNRPPYSVQVALAQLLALGRAVPIGRHPLINLLAMKRSMPFAPLRRRNIGGALSDVGFESLFGNLAKRLPTTPNKDSEYLCQGIIDTSVRIKESTMGVTSICRGLHRTKNALRRYTESSGST